MNTEGKPLSKEEILDYIVKDWATQPTRQDCYQAMDEYAEIEAIGFTEWQAENGFYRLKYVGDGNLYTREKPDGKFLTIKQLYQLYKTQQP